MVSVLDSGLSGPVRAPAGDINCVVCVVFLGKTLYSHRVSQPLVSNADFAFTSEEEGIHFKCTKMCK